MLLLQMSSRCTEQTVRYDLCPSDFLHCYGQVRVWKGFTLVGIRKKIRISVWWGEFVKGIKENRCYSFYWQTYKKQNQVNIWSDVSVLTYSVTGCVRETSTDIVSSLLTQRRHDTCFWVQELRCHVSLSHEWKQLENTETRRHSFGIQSGGFSRNIWAYTGHHVSRAGSSAAPNPFMRSVH